MIFAIPVFFDVPVFFRALCRFRLICRLFLPCGIKEKTYHDIYYIVRKQISGNRPPSLSVLSRLKQGKLTM